MRTMPASYDCRVFGFTDNQTGLFFDSACNVLIRGQIKDYMLEGVVEQNHDDYMMAAFRVGYSYDDWDLQHVTWFPEDIFTWTGFSRWLNDPRTNEKQILAYFKAKDMLKKSILN